MPAKRWVWDLRPLDGRAVKNQQVPDDGTAPGQTTTIQVPEPRRRTLAETAAETAGLPPPPSPGYVRTIPRKVYMPTDDDLAIVRRWRPDDDPRNPPWYKVKAELQAAGARAIALQLDLTDRAALQRVRGRLASLGH